MTLEASKLIGLEPLYNEREAAEILKLKPRALQAWRQRGQGPKFIRISSRAVRYSRTAILEWLSDKVKSSTSES